MVKRAKELGHEALALTDHGTITGGVDLYKAAKDEGIKPILGIEAYFVDDVAERNKDEKRYHIVIFGSGLNGYRNLCKIMTKAHDYFYRVPRIDMEMLASYSDDLYVSTACSHGLLSHPNFKKIVKDLVDIFDDRVRLEIMPINLAEQKETNEKAVWASKKYHVPIIATNDSHYLTADQSEVHNFLLSMNTGGKLQFDIEGLYLANENDMVDRFKKNTNLDKKIIKRAIDETDKFAENILEPPLSPKPVELPEIVSGDPNEALSKLAFQGLENIYEAEGYSREDYESRLKYELDVIKQKDFASYFLMVEDFVRYARESQIEMGAGRGSSAGSLCCYSLRITDVDPIELGLQFERFLNPERTDWPDIDIDFPKSRRHEILDYARETYGENRVAHIATVSRMQPKVAFKDTCRYFGLSFAESDSISKEFEDVTDIAEYFAERKDLKNRLVAVAGKRKSEEIIKYSSAITGTLRHGGVHAGGIVISRSPISDFAILENREGVRCANWTMDEVDYLGHVKVDFLGLRNLDVNDEAKRLIKDRYGVVIDWDEVDVNDPKVFRAFGDGHTIGTFQFESALMTNLLKRMAPIKHKSVLIDANALGRPGPRDSGMTDQYIANLKLFDKGEELKIVTQKGKLLYDITRSTCAVVVYQEQITEILRRLAGYSTAQADIIRRIVAKSKGTDAFEAHRHQFTEGCANHSSLDCGVASSLFDDLQAYSRYSFNKSHAAAYTELALRQMWLKLNYPVEFIAALLKYPSDKEDKKAMYPLEADRLGVPILPPDINLSKEDVEIEEDSIFLGFKSVKGLGKVAIDCIVKNRNGGAYSSLEDFRERNPRDKINKSKVGALLRVGAFDMLGVNSKSALENYEYVDQIGKCREGKIKKVSMDMPEDLYRSSQGYTKDEKEIMRKELLPGVYHMDIKLELRMDVDVDELEAMREKIKVCEKCNLVKYYHMPVPFDYGAHPKLLIIGEAPGEKELEEGMGFVGKAGKRLFSAFKKVGIKRSDLIVTNVYQCRPWDNKLPANPPEDCYGWLKKLIKLTRPGLVMAFGGTPKKFFTGEKSGIQKLAGKITNEVINYGDGPLVVPVLWSIHPASMLYGNDPIKKELWVLAFDQLTKIIKGRADGKERQTKKK
jgi:DNA polymerase-3 subunit alpha